ncbi:uncharacterized protein A4U43_C05F10240 [Asparagus officinalis]|uniref:Protein kinase domain-containing protein n=2 Tax=Asparagus officinalis TaxID=4686 RepID=A0A5P1EQN1_ASPOF|nr:receptor-like protein kinase HSL1 isoform X1 [Asparagus officinalis]ONK68325.1 uncharacterized protein A4U43_C05F10240 [Asparagus officinalis]
MGSLVLRKKETRSSFGLQIPETMEEIKLSFHFFAIFLLCIFQPSSSQTAETQALLDFRKQLKDPMNYLESWNESLSPCQFVGITCDFKSGNVIGIALVNMSLSGQISPSISALRSLSSLELQTNTLSGKIPPELNDCTNLQTLNLSANSFTGELPDLSSLQKLQLLDFSMNQLSGNFPLWVGNISGLVQLCLAENNFEHGKLPPSIGNLKNLTLLYLAKCNLIGEIPDSIFGLVWLRTLDLSMNQVSGKLSKEISNLHNLYKIELYQNNLSGEIPPELANLSGLNEFDISHNNMGGTLPPEIGNLNFTYFQIYRNNFHGELPKGFGNMRFLKGFSIYENNFSGNFPASLGRFSPLDTFDISENNFSGKFPRFLCQNNKLVYLLALDNNFSGEFPDSYSSCKSLLRFRISQNKFTGKIPDGLWGLPYAVVIDVADNGFIGGISSDIGVSTSLTQLYVHNNKFSGELPPEIGKLYQLQKLFAHNNSFSGRLPSQIGDLDLLTSLHLEINSFAGSLPSELVYCSRLVDLDLAKNSLDGVIPEKISLLTSLNSLNLSNNMLVGSIPVGLQSLKLSSLDLSKNQLSGEIPPELLMIAGEEAFSSNAGLCVDGNSGNNSGLRIGYCSLSPRHKSIYVRGMLVVLIIMSVLFVLLSALAIIASYKSVKKIDPEKGNVDPSTELELFHPADLDAEEICNLRAEDLIGSGGTGKVFRLDLNKNRGTFAVKQLWKGEGAKVVTAEIGILGKIRHRNILKLYARATRGGCSYLVFEYMPNGNLHQALRRGVKGGKLELDWGKRYNIAVGAAKGITYLHHDCSPAILHRDIKSTNILLDEECEAKIADFGIAKVAEESDNSCFAGTHGYMAPELAYSLKVTEKSDVYSFGVVLLELLTGLSPTGPHFDEGKDIVYWVSTHLDNIQKIRDIFDPRISGSYADDMIKVLRVAILCTANLPAVRPSMREVVKMLIDANPYVGVKRGKVFAKNC